jgi:transitional endoplasmic reticulum ATPase
MHSLYDRPSSIPTLYVKSFFSFQGPENSIRSIFRKARETAPCFLVMEDIDSLVTDELRSYFFNEMDGLSVNDGIMLVASTNHRKWLPRTLSLKLLGS